MQLDIPLPWRLLEAVERGVDFTNPVWIMGIFESRGFLHEDRLIDMAVEECRLEIHLATLPAIAGQKGEDEL